MRGGIDPLEQRVRPGGVGVAEIWKDFSSDDGTLSPSGEAERRRRPNRQLPTHVGPMSPNHSAIISPWVDPHNARRYRTAESRNHCFCSRDFGVADL